MVLVINGVSRTFSEGIHVSELLEELGVSGKYVAVERNRNVVSFRDYETTMLQDGDQIEVVSLVGGG